MAMRTPVKAPGPRPKAMASTADRGDAGLVEQVADHRQQALGVQARDHLSD